MGQVPGAAAPGVHLCLVIDSFTLVIVNLV